MGSAGRAAWRSSLQAGRLRPFSFPLAWPLAGGPAPTKSSSVVPGHRRCSGGPAAGAGVGGGAGVRRFKVARSRASFVVGRLQKKTFYRLRAAPRPVARGLLLIGGRRRPERQRPRAAPVLALELLRTDDVPQLERQAVAAPWRTGPAAAVAFGCGGAVAHGRAVLRAVNPLNAGPGLRPLTALPCRALATRRRPRPFAAARGRRLRGCPLRGLWAPTARAIVGAVLSVVHPSAALRGRRLRRLDDASARRRGLARCRRWRLRSQLVVAGRLARGSSPVAVSTTSPAMMPPLSATSTAVRSGALRAP